MFTLEKNGINQQCNIMQLFDRSPEGGLDSIDTEKPTFLQFNYTKVSVPNQLPEGHDFGVCLGRAFQVD